MLLWVCVGQRISRSLIARKTSSHEPLPDSPLAVRPRQLPRSNINRRLPRSRCLNPRVPASSPSTRPSHCRLLSSLESLLRVRQGHPPGTPRLQSRDPKEPASPRHRPSGAAAGKPRRLPKTRVRVCGKRGPKSNKAIGVRHAAAGLLTMCLDVLLDQTAM